MREEQFDQIVTSIYDAAVAPGEWGAALTQITRLFDGWGAQILTWNESTNTMMFSAAGGEINTEAERLYGQHYGSIDPRRQMLAERPIGSIIACHNYFDNSFVKKSEFYQDFLIPQGGRFVAGGRLFVDRDVSGVIGIHRSTKRGPFDDEDLSLLERLFPHLARALKIYGRFVDTGGTLRHILNTIYQAVIIADKSGRIAFMNSRAETIVAQCDGLRISHGALTAETPGQTNELLHQISGAIGPTGNRQRQSQGVLSLNRRKSTRPLVLMIIPLSERTAVGFAGIGPAAIILIGDPDQQTVPRKEAIRRLFGLTESEARVASALAEGKSIAEIAQETGRSKNTIRVQTQMVLEKTGTSRQAQLVQLLSTIPVLK